MVEFGAGGQLVHAEETPAVAPSANAAATGEAAGEGSGANGEEAAPTPAPQPATPRPTRRKRKAKGWFCPVCRQPYTSLLRISTTAPPSVVSKVKQLENEDGSPSPTPESPTQRPGFLPAIMGTGALLTGSENNNAASDTIAST